MPVKSPAIKIIVFFNILFFLFSSSISLADDPEYLVKLPIYSLNKKNTTQSVGQSLGLKAPDKLKPVIENSDSVLEEWYVIQSDQISLQELTILQAEGKIQIYQKNHALRVFDSVPNDTLYAQQWYHARVAGVAAWAYYQPKQKIILAVIDTGIDYLHPDLQGSLWVNTAEDLNSNGLLDDQDINGIDDDDNGYIDDVWGWDFTDAPQYRDLGDYIDPDNDPMDEYYNGHGTQIAGIISAQSDNLTGISGLVPGVQIMNLRAGTSQGYLEEDDVARAIVYAVENGAHIINMSFGDIVVSPFLQDAIRYAYSRGVTLVTSAGNSGTNETHYPSGFPETISVGAVNESDLLANFSSWGPTVDLVAPGADILSTAINRSYSSVNGTSFSAPIVSAAAAILLAENPHLNQDQVRNLLRTNSVDLGEPGWDEKYGSGRIDLQRVARNELQNSLAIHEPLGGSSDARNNIPVIITAQDQDLRSVKLEMGLGPDPDVWEILISDYRYQIISDTLTILDLSTVGDTTVSLRITITNLQGAAYEYRSVFETDRTPPGLSNLEVTKLLNQNRNAVLIEFMTNEVTRGELYFRKKSSDDPFRYKALAYTTTNHRILLDAFEITGDIEFYISLKDNAGLTTIADNNQQYFETSIDGNLVSDAPVKHLPWSIPAGHALSEATDFDQDGWAEIVISVYDDKKNYGPIQVYEFDGAGFQKIYESEFPSIPRAYGDSDKDGKPELLIGYGSISRLLEVSGTEPLTMQIILEDTGSWASSIDDCDSDGQNELIMRYGKTYRVLENTADNQYSEVFVFENPSAGNNSLGAPSVQIIDLDGDNHKEFVFGDYDGDVIIFENTGNNLFTWRHTERLPNTDATNYMTAAHYNDNENPLLVTGSYTLNNINYEHEFDARYWQFRILQASSDNTYQAQQNLSIYWVVDQRLFDSGFSAGILKPLAPTSFILAPAPNLYIFEFQDERLIPKWFTEDAQSNTIIIHDFDKDGINEFYYSNGERFNGYAFGEGNRPSPPSNFSAVPLDSSAIELTWYASTNFDKHLIYRGKSDLELTALDSTTAGTSYIDSSVVKDSIYYYAVQVVDNTFEVPESALSKVNYARPNAPPVVDSIVVINDDQIQLFFNENMTEASFLPENFYLTPGNQYARSAISAGNHRACIITFSQKFNDQTIYQLDMNQITDMDRTNIDLDSRQVSFYYQDRGNLPYLEKWEYSGLKTIDVVFNMPMDTSTILDLNNYHLLPRGRVTGVELLDIKNQAYRIHMSTDSYTGASGVSAYLEMRHLKSIQGRVFTNGNKISLVREVKDIADIYVYPQPARISQDWLGFANVAPDSRVDIFDIRGKMIQSLSENDGNGGIRWDLTNKNGEKIAAGIYLFFARGGDKTKSGKFTIVK